MLNICKCLALGTYIKLVIIQHFNILTSSSFICKISMCACESAMAPFLVYIV